MKLGAKNGFYVFENAINMRSLCSYRRQMGNLINFFPQPCAIFRLGYCVAYHMCLGALVVKHTLRDGGGGHCQHIPLVWDLKKEREKQQRENYSASCISLEADQCVTGLPAWGGWL